jgi:acetyl-CoA acyltransferase
MTAPARTAVIVDAVRTASGRGKPGGRLSGTHPADLLAHLLQALVSRTGLDPELIEDVITGCVSQVGEQSVNIGRSAVLAAGFPVTVPATTIDRQCGSSQQAAHFGAQGIIAGAYDVVVAGGVEVMSRVSLGSAPGGSDPYGPAIARRFPGGLVNQGVAAELIAARWKLDRGQLDDFAARSHALACAAQAGGLFEPEVIPVETGGADGESVLHTIDETVRPGTTSESLAGLRPAFQHDAIGSRFPEISWSITAGNSSPLTDGAACILIMEESTAKRLGMRIRARFHSFAVVADDPIMMLTAPIPATQRILARSGLKLSDIDTFEVNEAFSSIPLAWASEFEVDPARLNPRGGAIALGHPVGASGARLMTTMVNHLEHTGGRFGLQVMCEGGGLANATIIERV